MTPEQLKEIRELAYGMSVGNLNPEDVADYMEIASACARMESRGMVRSHSPAYDGADLQPPPDNQKP